MHGRIFFFVMIVQLQFHCIEFEVSKVIKRGKMGNPNFILLQSDVRISSHRSCFVVSDFGFLSFLFCFVKIDIFLSSVQPVFIIKHSYCFFLDFVFTGK